MTNTNNMDVTRLYPDGPPPEVVTYGLALLVALTARVTNQADGLAWLRVIAATEAYNRAVDAAIAAHPAGKGRA